MNNIERTIQVSNLIADYLNGTLSETGRDDLLLWIHEADQNRNLFEKICNEQNLVNAYALFNLFDDQAALRTVKTNPGFNARKPVIFKRLWPRYIGIAAAVAVIVFGVWFYNEIALLRKAPHNDEWVKNDIAPGKNTATLTINGGQAITLSEAKTGVIIDASQIKYNDGTAVGSLSPSVGSLSPAGRDGAAREGETKTLTVTTPRGGTYQVRLPDGTDVWLNAASSLTYTTALKERGVERVVKLSGEAYFEVAKMYSSSLSRSDISPQRGERSKVPFIVQSGQQELEVLGTHFNVNAYPENAVIRTTLAEGSIKISVLKKILILKPNEQATLLAGQLKKTTVDAEFALAWKSGFFLFSRERLESIMLKVARWYDVDVVYSDESLKAETFTGTISRYENISQVFGMLERTGVAKFKIEDKKVTIIKIQKD